MISFLTKGVHSLKFGFAIENIQTTAFNPAPVGEFLFLSLYDSNNSDFHIEAILQSSLKDPLTKHLLQLVARPEGQPIFGPSADPFGFLVSLRAPGWEEALPG
jgi:hypothetical protein